MKSRSKAASMFLLFAMVLSLVPAAVAPSPVSAAQSCTDRAQFVSDVTVPDGTRFDPGATFKKTWRIKNVGTCTWSNSYTLVYDSGTQMGSTTSVAHPGNTPPGQTVDVSVDLTAPNAAGNYRGYWKFKNASGTLFGIGVTADRPWWVQIVVTGSSQVGVVYNFTNEAGAATWSSGAGGLSFPGTENDTKGFALRLETPTFESAVTATQPGLLVSPHQITNGYIQAEYPEFTVRNGDRFQATVGCQAQATACYVEYRLDYKVGTTTRTFWRFRERYEGWTYNANLNLSPLAGQNVKFILYISAYGSPTGDRAIWGNPVIVRPGVTTTPTATATGTPPTATPTSTGTVPPSACDRAQFIADVTVPDGTVMNPGQTFRKTWRLKNVGTCAWSTSYQLVFSSGERMNGPASAAFTANVPVGATFDFSVDLTAPSTAGSYRGYWMFKNANGQLFGIGAQANKPWWVDIRVAGTSTTPTATPTGTRTPGANAVYNFAVEACNASWFSGAGALPCPGTDGDAKGFVLKLTNPRLETGVIDNRPGLLTFPQNVQNGYIQGIYPAFRVQTGDRFRSIINCEGGATLCYVAFRLDYQAGTDPTIRTFWGPFRERNETETGGRFYQMDVNLNSLAGKDVKFILTVLTAGVATGDRALWVDPHIYRPGATTTATATPTSGTATATPTSTTTTTATSTPTPTATATGQTSTATPTPTATGTATATSTGTATSTPTGTATSTATATATATLSGGGSTSGVYQNVKYNFKFTLPAGAAILSQTDNAGRVRLPIIRGGTNLLEKYVQVSVVDNASPCASPDVDGVPTSTENVTINGIQFVKRIGQGAAAGNRYDWTDYSTTYNNSCISMAFVLHSADPGVYATPPPVYDTAQESAVFGATINTFNRVTF